MASISGHMCHLSCILTVFIVTGYSATVTSKTCIDYFTIEGIQRENLVEDQGNITINYYFQAGDQLSHNDRYTIHWDEKMSPVIATHSQMFLDVFNIDHEDDKTWEIYPKKFLIDRYPQEEVVELTCIYGPINGPLTCTVTVRHILVTQETGQRSQKVRRGAEDKDGGRSAYSNKIEQQPVAVSLDLRSISTSNSERLYKKSVQYLLDDENKEVTTPTILSTVTLEASSSISNNIIIALSVIGGVLGLALIVGISVGLHYNYKRNQRLGLFRRKPQKQISLLGAAYPNIATSNTDMRSYARDAYEASSMSYPNYGFANPAATEIVPTYPNYGFANPAATEMVPSYPNYGFANPAATDSVPTDFKPEIL